MDLETSLRRLQALDPIRVRGRVTQVVGLVIEGKGPPMAIGDLCRILTKDGRTHAIAEVVGFRGKGLLMMALGETNGLEPGSLLEPLGQEAR
ncbi:MAG: EscN/YscN/HrcN family type III secretion system ATPase, partial [Deltaproteobacteria bacterium]